MELKEITDSPLHPPTLGCGRSAQYCRKLRRCCRSLIQPVILRASIQRRHVIKMSEMGVCKTRPGLHEHHTFPFHLDFTSSVEYLITLLAETLQRPLICTVVLWTWWTLDHFFKEKTRKLSTEQGFFSQDCISYSFKAQNNRFVFMTGFHRINLNISANPAFNGVNSKPFILWPFARGCLSNMYRVFL